MDSIRSHPDPCSELMRFCVAMFCLVSCQSLPLCLFCLGIFHDFCNEFWNLQLSSCCFHWRQIVVFVGPSSFAYHHVVTQKLELHINFRFRRNTLNGIVFHNRCPQMSASLESMWRTTTWTNVIWTYFPPCIDLFCWLCPSDNLPISSLLGNKSMTVWPSAWSSNVSDLPS